MIIAGATLLVAGGVYGAILVGDKLADLRHRFQLIEARQDSILRLAAARMKREQHSLGPAQIPSSRFNFAGTWERHAGPGIVAGWPHDYERSKALVVHGDRLHAGISRPRGAPPQVWRTDGARWERIGSDAAAPEWASLKQVTALASHAGALVAALDDTVWAFGKAGWRRIGGGGLAWPAGAYANAYALAVKDETLYVGMHGGDAAVYAYARGHWRKIAGGGTRNSWSDARYKGVYELWMHSDGHLYAGLVANPGPTAVFRYDGERWEKVGGDGVNGSWTFPGFTYALSFASHEGRLVLSMNRHPMIEDDFSSIWSFDGQSWRPVGLGHIPALWGEMHNYNAVASYRGLLLIGAGGFPAGNTSLWAVREGRPELIGGRGANGSWGRSDRDAFDWLDRPDNDYVYRVVEWRGDLYVGFGDHPGSAELWRFRPVQD